MGRPSTLPDSWMPLVEAAGGVSALAAELQFANPSGLYKLAHGIAKPGRLRVSQVRAWCAARGLVSPL